MMSSEVALGEKVVEHFRDRGLREFACCDADAGRMEAFRDAARQVGRCEVFDWEGKEDLEEGGGEDGVGGSRSGWRRGCGS